MSKYILVCDTDVVAYDLTNIRDLCIIEVSDESYEREFVRADSEGHGGVINDGVMPWIGLGHGGFGDDDIDGCFDIIEDYKLRLRP